MTREQYERWVDFATRMARTYPQRNAAMREAFESCVVNFIECHTSDGKDIAGVSGWDEGKNGSGYACDHFSEWWWSTMRVWYDAPRDYYEDRRRGGTPKAFERWEERWVTPVSCCIRAGLDMASAPSAGVVGFTVGDLKRMYPEGIPAWVSEGMMDDEGKPVDLNAEPASQGVWL